MMGTDPFLWIAIRRGDPDPDHLFIRLCDQFPDPDPPFVTRSFADPDPLFLTRSRSRSDRRSMIAILPNTDCTTYVCTTYV